MNFKELFITMLNFNIKIANDKLKHFFIASWLSFLFYTFNNFINLTIFKFDKNETVACFCISIFLFWELRQKVFKKGKFEIADFLISALAAVFYLVLIKMN